MDNAKISFWETLNLDKFAEEPIKLVFHNHWDYIPEKHPPIIRQLLGEKPRLFKDDEALFDLFKNGESEFIKSMMTLRGNKRLSDGEIAFSFIPYPYGKHTHILVSAFRVIDAKSEVVKKEDLPEFAPYLGRLIITYDDKKGNNPARSNPSIIKKLTIATILSISAAEMFPGYNKVKLTYRQLENVLKIPDWAEKLKARKGVYVIVDKNTGKQYIGSAYGKDGIYGRWNTYIESNGDIHEMSDNNEEKIDYPNEEFKRIIRENGGKKYIKENFQYSLLETFNKDTNKEEVIARESEWKDVLLTKEHGYNKN